MPFQYIGNEIARKIWVLADHVENGNAQLRADFELVASMLLVRYDRNTGLLGKANFQDYSTSANGVKSYARLVGYIGIENIPFRKQLADALAKAFAKKGVSNPRATRNWSCLCSLSLQQTEHRSEELYTAIENLAKRFTGGADSGYGWMTLSTASAWLNWDLAPCEAFNDPSVNLCYNGLNRPYRYVVGPFGKWVNSIEKAPHEIYGHAEFSMEKYNLRERNRQHEKRQIVELVPASAEKWEVSSIAGKSKLSRQFSLSEIPKNPYLKLQWNHDVEVFINGISMGKKLAGIDGHVGIYLPKEVRQSLKKGDNSLVVVSLEKAKEISASAGLIDWK